MTNIVSENKLLKEDTFNSEFKFKSDGLNVVKDSAGVYNFGGTSITTYSPIFTPSEANPDGSVKYKESYNHIAVNQTMPSSTDPITGVSGTTNFARFNLISTTIPSKNENGYDVYTGSRELRITANGAEDLGTFYNKEYVNEVFHRKEDFERDFKSMFKIYQTNMNTNIPANSRKSIVMTFNQLPDGYIIVGYRQISIGNNSSTPGNMDWQKVFITFFSTNNGGRNAQVALFNSNSSAVDITVSAKCLFMKVKESELQ